MKIKVSNNLQIINPTSEIIEWCENELSITNPLWQQLKRLGKDDTIRYRHIQPTLNCYRLNKKVVDKNIIEILTIPFGCLYGLWEIIKKYQCDIETDFSVGNKLTFGDKICPLKLYDYQEESLDALLSAKGGVLEAGCGAGKTLIGIELIKKINQKFLWIVHTKELLNQAKKDFLNLYPNAEIGEITDGKVNIGRDGAVSTIQTLSNIDPSIYAEEFGVVFVDECHHCVSDPSKMKMFQKVLNNCKARYRYGVTATPYRSDSLGKTLYFNLGMHPSGELRPVFKVEKERTNTLKATYVPLVSDIPYSYAVLNSDGTFNYSELVNYLCFNEQRNELIVNKVIDLVKEGRKISILSLRVEHCELLAKALVEKGIKAVCVTGQTSSKIRKNALDKTDDWDVIISTVSLFKEGIDIVKLDTVFMVAPIKDKGGTTQACGRCERKKEGKKEPLFIDVYDKNFPYCVSACKKRQKYIEKRK